MINKFCSFLALLFYFFVNTAFAQTQAELSEFPSGRYLLDKSHANIIWKVSHLGLSPYVGRFTEFDFKLILNTKDLSKSTMSAEVNAASISTENDKFDKTLVGKSWFNSEEFSTITFSSTSFETSSDDTGKLIGVLEMFGIQQIVEFDVVINGLVQSHPFISNSVAIGFTATSVIDRSQWGFDKFSGSVAQDVSIEISGEFTKQK